MCAPTRYYLLVGTQRAASAPHTIIFQVYFRFVGIPNTNYPLTFTTNIFPQNR